MEILAAMYNAFLENPLQFVTGTLAAVALFLTLRKTRAETGKTKAEEDSIYARISIEVGEKFREIANKNDEMSKKLEMHEAERDLMKQDYAALQAEHADLMIWLKWLARMMKEKTGMILTLEEALNLEREEKLKERRKVTGRLIHDPTTPRPG